MFDGNSLTAGYHLPDPATQSYPAQTTSLLSQQVTNLPVDYAIRNFGVSGQTTFQMLSDVTTQVDPLYNVNNAENIAFCWEGINDLYTGASPTEAYNHLVTYCQGRKNVGFKPVIVTILPKNQDATFEINRQAINASILNNWQTFADYLIDIGSDSTIGRFGSEVDSRFYQTDNIHLNAFGVAIVASYAKAGITYLSTNDGGKALPSQNLTYIADGDANGLLYWLGTNYGTELWTNPVTSGKVTFTASTLYDNDVNNHPETLCNRDVNNFNPSFASSDIPNSYFQVDLGPANKLQPSYYSLRGRNNIYSHPRQWQFLGSNDTLSWDVLDDHSITTNSVSQNTWLSSAAVSSKGYRYLRLSLTGTNTSDVNVLTLGQWEFYGNFSHNAL